MYSVIKCYATPQMGMIDRGAAVQCFSQFPGEAEVRECGCGLWWFLCPAAVFVLVLIVPHSPCLQILFAPLTGLEVVGQPRVEGKSIVVEIRLNTNLHDLTIEQVRLRACLRVCTRACCVCVHACLPACVYACLPVSVRACVAC